MADRVLICDDSVAVHRSLSTYLKNEGIEVISVFTGEDAINTVKSLNVDMVILDIMLPGISGLDVCREIRKYNEKIYIMMLSAKGDLMDRVIGLEIGADDYVAKPFSPKEVSIRIRKILTRLKPDIKEHNELITYNNLIINPDSYQAYCEEKLINLTNKEMGVLLFLVKNAGRAVSRENIIENVWGYDYEGDIRAVDSLMKRLKQKLKDSGAVLKIKSIYGVGFRLDRIDEK